VITPANAWDDLFDAPGIDLPDRQQPQAGEREEF
jgi:antitoxin VapB